MKSASQHPIDRAKQAAQGAVFNGAARSLPQLFSESDRPCKTSAARSLPQLFSGPAVRA
jgi:hypothetical protein